MNDTLSPARPTRDQLRQQFLDQAAAAFDLMFAPDGSEQLVTFDQREQRALELGQQLLTSLLQQHANADPAADPPAGQPPLCPHCRRPGRRAAPADDPFPPRTLTTSAGGVTLRRTRFRCTACRAVFFPPR
jgi:hypothetical protein